MTNRLQGASQETIIAHAAEIIFRGENRDLPSGVFFTHIQQAIKVTGPINKAPQNLDVWGEYVSIMVYEKNIRSLRKNMAVNPDGHRLMINNYQVMIEERLRTIRRMMRARGSQSRFRMIDGGKVD